MERERISIILEGANGSFNLKQLYYFHVVATEGSIARAARRLNLSQPSISEQIKNLERYLEKPLFDRKPGGVQLNSDGHRVYEHTKVMFRAARRMIQEINPSRTADNTVLEIGLCPTVTRSLAVERLLPLLAMREVTPRVRFGSYDVLLGHLLANEVDLVLTENSPPLSNTDSIEMRCLSRSPLVFVGNKVVADSISNLPEGLSRFPLIHYASSCHRWDVDSFLFEAGLSLDVIAEIDDTGLLVAAALSQPSIIAVPERAVSEHLETGKLFRLCSVGNVVSCVNAQFLHRPPSTIVREALELLLPNDEAPTSGKPSGLVGNS